MCHQSYCTMYIIHRNVCLLLNIMRLLSTLERNSSYMKLPCCFVLWAPQPKCNLAPLYSRRQTNSATRSKTVQMEKYLYLILGWTVPNSLLLLFHHYLCLVFASRELFSPAQKYQLLVYHADAIFHDKEYRNAACKYSMALQQKKVLSKTSKVRTSTGGAASNIQAQVREIRLHFSTFDWSCNTTEMWLLAASWGKLKSPWYLLAFIAHT